MQKRRLLFGKKNFIIVTAGIGVILLGFLLMAGGASTDVNVYPEDAIYGFRRTVLAPIVVLLGFALQIVAIFTPSNDAPEEVERAAATTVSKTVADIKSGANIKSGSKSSASGK